MKYAVFCAAVAALTFSACGKPPASTRPQAILEGPNGSWNVSVEIAEDEKSRQHGLMGREYLSEDDGMLFIMDESHVMNFWMKNTLIPLDIMFFDAGGRLVATHTMTPCKKDPCKTYSSKRQALYALEVGAGMITKKGVGTGWTLKPPSR